jgi:hypothetical protein
MPRPICEAFRSIDVCRIYREGGLRSGRCYGYSWTRLGEPLGEVRMTVESDILFLLAEVPNSEGSQKKTNVQGVSVAWTPCRFGGQRPWFLCPVNSCRRRCAKVYLAEDFFACRRCLGLAYARQQEPVRQRGLHKARKIRASLGGSANMMDSPLRRLRTHSHLPQQDLSARRSAGLNMDGCAAPARPLLFLARCWPVRRST